MTTAAAKAAARPSATKRTFLIVLRCLLDRMKAMAAIPTTPPIATSGERFSSALASSISRRTNICVCSIASLGGSVTDSAHPMSFQARDVYT